MIIICMLSTESGKTDNSCLCADFNIKHFYLLELLLHKRIAKNKKNITALSAYIKKKEIKYINLIILMVSVLIISPHHFFG